MGLGTQDTPLNQATAHLSQSFHSGSMWLEFLRTVRSTTKNEEIFSPNMGSRKMLTIVRNCSYFSKAYWTELFRKRYNKHLHFSYKIQRKHYFDWDISNELALFFKTLFYNPNINPNIKFKMGTFIQLFRHLTESHQIQKQ